MIGLRGLHEGVRPYAEWCADYYVWATGERPVITSTYRDWEKQRGLRQRYERCLAEGRFPDTDCPYPANRPGDSSHNYGLGWDSVVEPNLQPFWNAVREYVGFRVPPNDQIHAEVPNWRSYVYG